MITLSHMMDPVWNTVDLRLEAHTLILILTTRNNPSLNHLVSYLIPPSEKWKKVLPASAKLLIHLKNTNFTVV